MEQDIWGDILTGSTKSFGAGSSDVLLIKLAGPPPLTPPPTPTPSPTATPTILEEKGIAGFEAVFAIAGLLLVSYLLRKRK